MKFAAALVGADPPERQLHGVVADVQRADPRLGHGRDGAVVRLGEQVVLAGAPDLVVNTPQQLGRMFIVEGTTEVGAVITVNGERVELGRAGKFRKTVEMFKEGWNDILIVATDPSGNRSEHRERVFVEVY